MVADAAGWVLFHQLDGAAFQFVDQHLPLAGPIQACPIGSIRTTH